MFTHWPHTLPFAIIAAVILIANLYVCFIYFTSRMLRTFTNKFVISVAICDIMVGTIYIPFWIIYKEGLNKDEAILLAGYFNCFAAFGVLLNLMALTYERYVAIFKGLYYFSILTEQKVNVIIASVWLITLIATFIPLAWKFLNCANCGLIYQAVLIGVVIISILGVLAVYLRIFKVSHFQTSRSRTSSLGVFENGKQSNASTFSLSKYMLHPMGLKRQRLDTHESSFYERSSKMSGADSKNKTATKLNLNQHKAIKDKKEDQTKVIKQRRKLSTDTFLHDVVSETDHEEGEKNTEEINDSCIVFQDIPNGKIMDLELEDKTTKDTDTSSVIPKCLPEMSSGSLSESTIVQKVDARANRVPRTVKDTIVFKCLQELPTGDLFERNVIVERERETVSITAGDCIVFEQVSSKSDLEADVINKVNLRTKGHATDEEESGPIIFNCLTDLSTGELSEGNIIIEGNKSYTVEAVKVPAVLKPPQRMSTSDLSGDYTFSELNLKQLDENMRESMSDPFIFRGSQQLSTDDIAQSNNNKLHLEWSIEGIESPEDNRNAFKHLKDNSIHSLTQDMTQDKMTKESHFERETSDIDVDDFRSLLQSSQAAANRTQLREFKRKSISYLKTFLVEFKATKIIAVICAINCVCWVPVIFINIYQIVSDLINHKIYWTAIYSDISNYVFILNSAVNPFMYALFKKDFRRAIKRRFHVRRHSM